MPIRKAQPFEFGSITELWEASVRATHDFLSEQDIQALRPRLLHEWLPQVNLHVLTDDNEHLLGFSGVVGEKLEMLFVAPAARGQGVGKALCRHAITQSQVRLVDVNEQNSQAVGFYQRLGFEVIGRSALDGQGNPYPLLHMRLATD